MVTLQLDTGHMQRFDVGSYTNADQFSRLDMGGERCKNLQSLLPQVSAYLVFPYE